jgi:hypothetical protein
MINLKQNRPSKTPLKEAGRSKGEQLRDATKKNN